MHVATLVSDPTRLARLRAAFGSESVAVHVAAPDLIAASREPGVALVVLPARDRTGRSLASIVSAIRASRRSPPVFVYAERDDADIHELVPLGRAGCRGLILTGANDGPADLRRLVDTGSLSWCVDSVRHVAEDVVPLRYLPLVMYCLDHVTEPPSASAVARHLNVSRRTLSAWATQAGARGIRSLTSICRVLVAIELLRNWGRSIEQVAHALHFGSSAHLHNTVRRYTGLRPRDAALNDSASWCSRFFGPRHTTTSASHSGFHLPPAESRMRPAEWSVTPNDTILPPTNQARA